MTIGSGRVRLAVCAVIGGFVISARAADRAEVPDPKTLDTELRVVDQTFRLGAVGKDPAQQLAAARKLIEAAANASDPASVRYAELRRARDLAARVDLQTAMNVSDLLVKQFDLDAGRERLDLLASCTARPSVPAVERVISWSDEAMTAGRIDQARRLADAAVSLAAPLRSPLVANDAREQSMRATKAAKEDRTISGLRARVTAKPDDVEAKLQLGRLLCVDQDNWDEGLPLLQQTPDVRLRAAVQLDLRKPSASNAELAAGDLWWDLADADRTFPAAAAHRRAAIWYERALPELEGLSKARAQARLDDAAQGDPNVLLGGPGKWVTLALSGTKWGLAPHPVTIERRGCSLVIHNPDTTGPLYLVSDRILPAGFAMAATVKGHCLIGLLSADRVDRSLYCLSPDDGAWHEVRLQREGPAVTAFQDGDPGQASSYKATPLMTGVVGFQINAGQTFEVRSVSVR